jgi:hypothetical protein
MAKPEEAVTCRALVGELRRLVELAYRNAVDENSNRPSNVSPPPGRSGYAQAMRRLFDFHPMGPRDQDAAHGTELQGVHRKFAQKLDALTDTVRNQRQNNTDRMTFFLQKRAVLGSRRTDLQAALATCDRLSSDYIDFQRARRNQAKMPQGNTKESKYIGRADSGCEVAAFTLVARLRAMANELGFLWELSEGGTA